MEQSSASIKQKLADAVASGTAIVTLGIPMEEDALVFEYRNNVIIAINKRLSLEDKATLDARARKFLDPKRAAKE